MMHLLSTKTSKQLFSSVRRSLVATSNKTQLCTPQAMSFFVVTKTATVGGQPLMTHVTKRHFALPPHITLEMPNLSPTMEKVNS